MLTQGQYRHVNKDHNRHFRDLFPGWESIKNNWTGHFWTQSHFFEAKTAVNMRFEDNIDNTSLMVLDRIRMHLRTLLCIPDGYGAPQHGGEGTMTRQAVGLFVSACTIPK